MRLIFMGSPSEVISPLKALMSSHEKGHHTLLGVISQPARPAGRKQVLTDPPVAEFAKQAGLSVWQPEKASHPDFLATLRDLAPDVLITAAYGQILSEAFLEVPKRATINIHPSLLPAYRGATPVPAALLDGCTETGVTVLFTVRALDAGAIIVQERFTIANQDDAHQLTDRLFQASGPLLLRALTYLEDPTFTGTPQDPSQVTLCKKIAKTDGQIDWGKPVDKLLHEFRAYQPWPGSYTQFKENRVVIEAMLPDKEPLASGELPGQFCYDKQQKALRCRAGDGSILITRLKPAGSKSVDAASFWNGAHLQDWGQFQ